MPRISPATENPRRYKEAEIYGFAQGDTNFCGPLALAMLAGVSMGEALTLCRAAGRKDRRGMQVRHLRNAFAVLGWELVEVDSNEFIRKYPGVHRRLRSVTSHHPRRFPEAFKNENLLAFTRNHFFSIVDGVTHCWSANKALRARYLYRLVACEPRNLPRGYDSERLEKN